MLVNGKWSNRISKVIAAVSGAFRYLPMQGLPGTRIRIPLEAHRRYWPGPMPDVDLVAFLAASIPTGGVFFDIGSNIGVYCAAIGVAKGRNIRGTAFEPIPATNQLLFRTLALNGLEGINVEAVALSSRESLCSFTAQGGGGNNFMVSAGDERGQITVKSVTLDQWVEAHPEFKTPHAIKIDVEGHELDVLRGAKNVLTRARPALVIECHCAAWPSMGVDPREVTERLTEYGYTSIVDRSGKPISLENCTQTTHILCHPPARA